MADRQRVPVAVTRIRIGRTDFGDGSIVIDDEAITMTVRVTVPERPLRLPLTAVNAIEASAHEVRLTLRDGTRLTFGCPTAPRMCEDLLLHCRAVPEVTRTLRAFGSSRGQRGRRAAASSDQQRFFAPLLEARREAGGAGEPAAVISSFEASALVQAVEQAIAEFVAERYTENGPARRALEAELTDLAEPLLLSLHALDDAASRATASIDDLRLWRQWAAQLRATFEVADRVWLTLDTALDSVVRKA